MFTPSSLTSGPGSRGPRRLGARWPWPGSLTARRPLLNPHRVRRLVVEGRPVPQPKARPSSAAPQSFRECGRGRCPAVGPRRLSGTIAAVSGTDHAGCKASRSGQGRGELDGVDDLQPRRRCWPPAASWPANCVTVVAAFGPPPPPATSFTGRDGSRSPSPPTDRATPGFGRHGHTRPSGAPTGHPPPPVRVPSGSRLVHPAQAERPGADPDGVRHRSRRVGCRGTSLVVASRTFTGGASGGQRLGGPPPTRTITLAATSTITEEEAATSTAIVRRQCGASAQGTADSSGGKSPPRARRDHQPGQW